MVNTRMIKARMIELGLTYEDLGKAMGKSAETIRHKIYNYRPMWLSEALELQAVLKIADEKFHLYFFTGESRSATEV